MLDSTLKAGAILDDRYQLLRQLGSGGCGAVWLAQDGHQPGREVVLKILHPHFDRYSLAVKQLAREAEVLEQLAHPNIAKPFAFSSAGVHTYLVMEHIDGRPLDQEIGAHTRADRHFTAAEVRRIFEELCSAVSHAHSRTVIHRDLKPQNVMVLKKGGLAVKVLDFGIAKLLEGNIFDATTFGRRLGSMFYMSPEQCKGEPADVRSDVFSLGVIAFEVITLRRAWAWDASERPVRAFDQPVPADGANSLSAVLMRVASAPRPRPSEARPGLPAKLDDVIMRAMSIEPDRRYQSVDAFLAELVRGLGSVSERASAPGFAPDRGAPGFAPERGAPGFVAELGGDFVTVKAQSPALGRPIYGDDSDTKMQAVPEPEIVPIAGAKGRVERTEALVEVKEREAKEREAKERDARDPREVKPERASVWKVGGSDAADLLETAMMAEAKEPELFDADSNSTGPTIGIKDAERIMAGSEAPRPVSAAAQLGVRAVSEDDARVRGRDDDARVRGREEDARGRREEDRGVRRDDGDPHGTVRGALAPEPGQNVKPSWRGRLPVPPVVAPVVAPVPALAPPPSSPQETVAEPFEPTLTPREKGGLTVDPRTAHPGGTELLFSVAEPQKLLVETSSDDHTPIHAAALRFSSGIELPPETMRELPTPPPALSFETKSLRGELKLVSARGPTGPGFADVPAEGPPSSTQAVIEAAGVGSSIGATLRALKSHRFAVIGLVGMVLAFVAGVMLARWAAEELRQSSAIEVPIEAPEAPGPSR